MMKSTTTLIATTLLQPTMIAKAANIDDSLLGKLPDDAVRNIGEFSQTAKDLVHLSNTRNANHGFLVQERNKRKNETKKINDLWDLVNASPEFYAIDRARTLVSIIDLGLSCLIKNNHTGDFIARGGSVNWKSSDIAESFRDEIERGKGLRDTIDPDYSYSQLEEEAPGRVTAVPDYYKKLTEEDVTLEVETFVMDEMILTPFIHKIDTNGPSPRCRPIHDDCVIKKGYSGEYYIKDLDLWIWVWPLSRTGAGNDGHISMYEHIMRNVGKENRDEYIEKKFMFFVPPKDNKYGLENKMYAIIPKLSDE